MPLVKIPSSGLVPSGSTITNPIITGGTSSGQAISGATITTSTVDGVSEAQFDLIANGAKATGTTTFKAYAAMANNQTLIVPGGVTFELQKEGVYATGSITAVAKANLVDNETFTLDDGVNAATVFEFQVTPNVYATGSITAVAKAQLVDGEQFVLDDGVNPAVTFEFDVAGDGVTGGTTAVDVSGATDADSVAVIIRAAINGVGAGLAITAGAPTGAVVPLTNDAYGAYNTAITDTVTDSGFTHTGMSGGSSFTPAGGGVVVIDVTGVTTAPQVISAIKTAINNVGAGLAITAGAITDATVLLANDAYGAYNAAITDTVTDAGFTHTGMTGGVAWAPTGGGVVVVDARGESTQAGVIALFGAAVTEHASTTISYVSETGGVASWIAKAYGTAVNRSTITGTTLTVTGMMDGGLAALAAIDLNNLLLGGAAASANASLAILGSKTVAVPASGTLWRALDVQASTLTLVAGGAAPSAVNLVYIAAPTITSTASYTIPVAATVNIAGAPTATGSASITAPLALRVETGKSYFASYVGINVLPGSAFHLDVNGSQIIRSGVLYVNTIQEVSGGIIHMHSIDIEQISEAACALQVLSNKTVASAADAAWNGVNFAASTLTLSGSTTPITALTFFNVAAPTVTAASAVVTTDFYTAKIAKGVFSGAGPASATRQWALGLADSLQLASGNIVVGTGVAAGASANLTVALHNGATAPSGSADLAHLYCADHNGTGGAASLALYQESALVASGDKAATHEMLMTYNGVPIWVLVRDSAG